MEGNIAKLETNGTLYENGVEFTKACRRYGLPLFLKSLQRVARFACRHHPGRFADGALENLALDVGEGMKDGPICENIHVPASKRRTSRTLHVATTLHAIGGHSRVLAKWVERDSSAEHLIVLTSQWYDPPSVMRDRIVGSGSSFMKLPAFSSLIHRAAMLRRISQDYDRVILHTHPYDCIPVLAFATQSGPPVAMFNHAHFSFNLGSTVSDIIVNTVEYYRGISKKHRFARSTALLTGVAGMQPIDDGAIDKAAARRELSLPEDATVIMSLAYEPYYTPMGGYHFFGTLKTLMENLPDAYFLIVGVGRNSKLVSDELRSNAKVRLAGVVLNPIVYYKACDLFLESFPMPSLGAVHEAVGYGEAFPIAAYGPGESILHVNQPTFSYSERAPDEKAYVDYVTRQAKNKTYIREAARQMRTAMQEEDRLFGSKLDSLNTQIDALPHKPGKIPTTRMINSRDSRLLADLDPCGLGDKINSLYAFLPSIYYQLDAVLKGQQAPAAAVQSIAKPFLDGLRKAAARV